MKYRMWGMQKMMRWLATQYASYDEFSFWRTETRRDHSKLLDKVEYLQHQVNSLSAKIGPSSPPCTPTRIIDELQSPEVMSRSPRPSERMTRATLSAQGLRKVPRKDLEECFKDCDDSATRPQVLPSRLPPGSKSPGTLSQGPKEARLARGTKSPRTFLACTPGPAGCSRLEVSRHTRPWTQANSSRTCPSAGHVPDTKHCRWKC